MRIKSFLLVASVLTSSAYAMLPTPTDTNEVSFGTVPTTSAVSIINPTVPSATTTEGLNTVVNAFLVKNDGAGETLVPINVGTMIKSGDVVEYQGLFTNNAGDRIRHMDVTLNIPAGIQLIGNVSPALAQGSNDGSSFVRMPIRASINGVVQDLPLSYYKALRWTIEDLGIGGTAVVKYRATIK